MCGFDRKNSMIGTIILNNIIFTSIRVYNVFKVKKLIFVISLYCLHYYDFKKIGGNHGSIFGELSDETIRCYFITFRI